MIMFLQTISKLTGKEKRPRSTVPAQALQEFFVNIADVTLDWALENVLWCHKGQLGVFS